MNSDANTPPGPLVPSNPEPPTPPAEPAAPMLESSVVPNQTSPMPAQLDPSFAPKVITPEGYPPEGQFSVNHMPAASVGSASFQMSDVPPPTPMAPAKRPRSKKKLFAGVAIVAGLLAIGGGYVFGIYLPNTPSAVYASSLKNTGAGVDQLIAYSKQQQQAGYTSTAFTGTLNVKSPSGSFDFNLNGSADKNANATATLDADIMGEKVTGNFRSVHVAGSTTPDMYVQVNGIKSYLDSIGLNTLDNLDGQWIAIDHTLLDTYESALTQNTGTGNTSAAMTGPTAAQIQDAETKMQAVNKQYVFTQDKSKAVLANEKFIGKDTVGGRTLDHYIVGYNKAHLEAYITALGGALDSSGMNIWSKQAYGKNLSQLVDVHAVENEVRNAKSDYTFDLWADTKTKLVGKLGFSDPTTKATMTLSQGYTGGSQFPFSLRITGKNDSGEAEDTLVNMALDTQKNNVTFSVADTTQASDGTTDVSGSFTATPGKSTVQVSAPAGAKPVVDILNSLGLGSLLGGGSPTADQSATPLIFQQ